MNKKLAFFTLIICSMILLTGRAFASTQTLRISGPDRYGTAAAISNTGWQQSDYAVIVYGENFPDALSASVLAKKYNAPILLTNTDVLNKDSQNELIRLKVKHVFIVGGPGVVSSNVEKQIQEMDISETRLYGADRYATSAAVAQQIGTSSGIILATGDDYGDALSISPIAAKFQMPILLVPKDSIPQYVKDFVSGKNIPKTYVLGGTDIISDSVSSQFANVQRITGNDKFDRNINIIKTFEDELSFNNIFIASGENFPDALSGSALASLNNNPIILTGMRYNPVTTRNYVAGKLPIVGQIDVLGGVGALLESTISDLTTDSGITVPGSAGELTIQDIAKNSSAVVYIEIRDSSGQVISSGSGFIVSQDGKVVTNYHVIDKAYSASATLEDGTAYEVQGVVSYDKDADLAVLKLQGFYGNNMVKLGDSDSLQIGDSVVAIGSPVGYKNSVSTGIVSSFRPGQMRTGNDIQISCPISPGSSGGALFNMYGEVIGITYAGRTDAQNLNFAIPINDVKEMLNGNGVKTLQQVDEEVYPGMSTDEFVKDLMDNYSNFQDGDYSFYLDDIEVFDDPDITGSTDTVYAYLNINSSNYSSMLNYAINNVNVYKEKIETWESEINNELVKRYPGMTIDTGIRYSGSYNIYPDGFDAEYINYNPLTMMWDVDAPLFFTTNSSGKFYCVWYYPFE